MQLMLQATVCDCLAPDPFAFEEDGLSAPEVARHGFVGIADANKILRSAFAASGSLLMISV